MRTIRSSFFISLAGVVESPDKGMARLFPPDAPRTPLQLLSSETVETGVLDLVYAPAK